jgi:hypothetical protein
VKGALDLPSQPYTAVKFYFNDCFPETERNRQFVHDTLAALSVRGPVVSLATGLRLDDHGDEGHVGGVIPFPAEIRPQENLAVQAAIVARASAFVGTYGGFSYLAPFRRRAIDRVLRRSGRLLAPPSDDGALRIPRDGQGVAARRAADSSHRMSIRHILVTGGAGYIGSHLVDALVTRGYRVTVLDSLEPQVHRSGTWPSYINSGATYVQGDVRDRAVFEPLVLEADAVVHFGAAVSVGQSMYQVDRYVDVNTRGTALLLDILVNAKHHVEKVLVASSIGVYGEGAYRCVKHGVVAPTIRPESQLAARDWEQRCPRCGEHVVSIPTPEDKPLYRDNIYSMTKLHQEEMVLLIGKTYGIPRWRRASSTSTAAPEPEQSVCGRRGDLAQPSAERSSSPSCSRTAASCATSCRFTTWSTAWC